MGLFLQAVYDQITIFVSVPHILKDTISKISQSVSACVEVFLE